MSLREKHSIRRRTAPICNFIFIRASPLRRHKVASSRNSPTCVRFRLCARDCARDSRPVVFFHARNSAHMCGDTLFRARECVYPPKIDSTAVVQCFVAGTFIAPPLRWGETKIFHYYVG